MFAEACLSVARFLGADGVWVSALQSNEAMEFPIFLDSVRRIFSAAQRTTGCIAEIQGPMTRARAIGGEPEEALRAIKAGLVAEFEALAAFRPDMVVLTETGNDVAAFANSRQLGRVHGTLQRLAGHYDLLLGVRGTPVDGADVVIMRSGTPATGFRAVSVATDWKDAGAMAGAVRLGREVADGSGMPLVVTTTDELDDGAEPEAVLIVMQEISERA
ncbi:MAG: hypothetical protein Kow0026_00070 [Oricola sp.]